MKQQAQTKPRTKLALRTETVRTLDKAQLEAVAGGVPTTTVWSHHAGC